MELWTIVEPCYDWCSNPPLSTKVPIVRFDPAVLTIRGDKGQVKDSHICKLVDLLQLSRNLHPVTHNFELSHPRDLQKKWLKKHWYLLHKHDLEIFFQFSACTNVSFNKLTQRFSANNAQHREMLAILAAITQVIKSRSGGDGGEETSTEYFAALLTTLESSESQETTSGLFTNSSFFRLLIEKKNQWHLTG